MLTVLSYRFKSTVLFAVMLLGVVVTPLARADVIDSCFSFLNAQDYARAETEAKALIKRKGLSREVQRYAYMCHGSALLNQGRMKEALHSWHKVEELSQSTEDLLSPYTNLGVVYYELGDFNRAELYDQRAYNIALALNDKSAEASALNNQAAVVNQRGDVERALTLYQQALAIEPNEVRNFTKLNNIAEIYGSRGEYDKAVEMLHQAVEIGRRNGDAHGVAQMQLNLGFFLSKQGKLQDAEKELTAGLNAIRLLGDKAGEAGACLSLAALSIAKKGVSQAREWYGKAEVLYREIGNTTMADKARDAAAALGK